MKEAKFLKMPVPLPSLDEQRRIVRQLDGVAALVDERRRAIEAAERETQALLLKAFQRAIDGATLRPMSEADVALPLVHDRVVAWNTVAPDIVQQMLIEGVAVDSPGDALLLHPSLFAGEKQAQKAFERIGFKRQIPMKISYREMSLKSAVYRRGGRGRSWQHAYWLSGSADAIRKRLIAALGEIAAWEPEG